MRCDNVDKETGQVSNVEWTSFQEPLYIILEKSVTILCRLSSFLLLYAVVSVLYAVLFVPLAIVVIPCYSVTSSIGTSLFS